MRYDHLFAQLKRFPERYLAFGPYWWTVKAAMRQAGFDFGPSDHPGVRAEIERAAGGQDAAVRRGMHFYADHVGGMGGVHDFTLPSGEPYFLHDDDVTQHAVI